jgi:hypothetical protein
METNSEEIINNNNNNSEQDFKEVKTRKSRKRKVQQMDCDFDNTINNNNNGNNETIDKNREILPNFEPIKKEKLSVFIKFIFKKMHLLINNFCLNIKERTDRDS